MPYFALHDHPQLPVTRAQALDRKPRPSDRDGFRLRYVLELPAGSEAHADDVIRLLDGAMGARTKAHGVYQAPYAEVRAAYGSLLGSVAPRREPFGRLLSRACAVSLGVALLATMCALITPVTVAFLVFAAVRKQSGLYAMFEASMLWSVLDWRRPIRRLLRYGLHGESK